MGLFFIKLNNIIYIIIKKYIHKLEEKEEKILNLITAIRESFGGSIAVYTCGNCYQFYEILKSVFPDAEAYGSGHVYTKIDGKFYDIRGEIDPILLKRIITSLIPITDPEAIKSLSVNKWTDKRRKEYNMEWIEKLKKDSIK